MPYAPPSACLRPGCPGRATRGGYCDAHRPRSRSVEDAAQNSRWYDRRWQRLRRQFLAEFPLCAHCDHAGHVREANVVDHIVPLRNGGARLDRANLQPLCTRHHAIKTAADLKLYI